MRVGRALGYVAFLLVQVARGSWQCTRNAFAVRPISTPSIVAYQSRCRSDFEITAMTSSITITPGTLVLGIATVPDSGSPVIYVHSLFDTDRQQVVAGLGKMEDRLLGAVRRNDREEQP